MVGFSSDILPDLVAFTRAVTFQGMVTAAAPMGRDDDDDDEDDKDGPG